MFAIKYPIASQYIDELYPDNSYIGFDIWINANLLIDGSNMTIKEEFFYGGEVEETYELIFERK